MIDVVEASDISEKNTVWRELALIKVSCKPSQRVEILELSKIFRVNVVDVGINNMTFEIAGGKSKIDSFEIPTGNPLLIRFENNLVIKDFKYLDVKRSKKIIFNV